MAVENVQYSSSLDIPPVTARPASCLVSTVRKSYCRERILPGLLPLWPNEIADRSLSGTARIVALLARALRSERRRGQAGHWAYDLSRHVSLVGALREERAELKRLAARAEAQVMSGRNRNRPPLVKMVARSA